VGTTPAETPNPLASGCAWIEGEYVPIAEARIPILDTGLTRSDLTYDVAGVWQGQFFRLDDHIDRLLSACRKIRLEPPLGRDQIREVMNEVVIRSGLRDAYVEIIVSRGVPGPGERDPRRWTPHVYAYAIPYVWIVRPELQDRGTDVIISTKTYRIPPDSVDPTVKNFQWADLVRGLFEAYDRGAWLALHTDREGFVTEGAGFNIFALIDNTLVTPDVGVLEGITRRTALEIADHLDVATRVGPVTADELRTASEIFLTSTAGGIMPVATLDGAQVGSGQMGPVTSKIRETYWDWHSDPRFASPIAYRLSASP